MLAAPLQRIAVLGAGQMGAGIAQVAARCGLEVALADVSLERAQSSCTELLARLDRLQQRGKLQPSEVRDIQSRLRATELDRALEQADLVIEAVTEKLEIKLALFARADAAAPKQAILASNTSSISITRLAGATTRPERVIGMHFMNPVPLMKLVEVVLGLQTGDSTRDQVKSLAERMGKTVIVSRDSPGFIVNRMLLPLLNEACFALQEGVGSASDIDRGAELGLNHPLGPLALADLIGLDTVLAIAEVLQRELGDDKYRAPTLLKNLVAAGWLGKKTSRGFYLYDERGDRLGPAILER